jgi:hypothetical protein
MTKTLYSLIIFTCISLCTMPVYSESHLQVTEQGKEQMIAAIESTVDPWSYNAYDLFRVYESKITGDGKTKDLQPQKKTFGPLGNPTFSLIIMAGFGLSVNGDFSTFQGANLEVDMLFMLFPGLGIRSFIATVGGDQFVYGNGLDFVLQISNIRMSLYIGMYTPKGLGSRMDIFTGITLGFFIPWYSSRGKRNFYLELDCQWRMDNEEYPEMDEISYIFNLKLGYRFF